MDLTLAQLLYKDLGWVGVVFVLLYLVVTFVGSLVDGAQFLWLWKRHKKRRQRMYHAEVEREVVAKLFREGKLPGG